MNDADLLSAAQTALAECRYADAQLLAMRANQLAAQDDISLRKAVERILTLADAACLLPPLPAHPAPEAYHRWYYEKMVWRTTSWCGVPLLKSISDLWNYQEIIFERRPSLVIEFGSHAGGSALFFAHVLQLAGLDDSRIISVDISHALLDARARACRTIEFIESSSTAPAVARMLSDRRAELTGSAFVILDSDHTEEHVYNELLALRPIVSSGDYVVVEDTNVNGHPVLPDFGPGPHEALTRYKREFPDDYFQDRIRESKFGFTFATDGFLIRR
jgi:cephalosporin hydroxylase